jgi:hypothetical protein
MKIPVPTIAPMVSSAPSQAPSPRTSCGALSGFGSVNPLVPGGSVSRPCEFHVERASCLRQDGATAPHHPARPPEGKSLVSRVIPKYSREALVGRGNFQAFHAIDELCDGRFKAEDTPLELYKRKPEHCLDLGLEPIDSLFERPHSFEEPGLPFRQDLVALSDGPDPATQRFSDDVEMPLDFVHLVASHPGLQQEVEV